MAKAKPKKQELTPSEWHGSEALKANLVAIESLTEDPHNTRGHDDKSVDAIAASLNRFGQLKPIVVRNGVVLAGNGSLRAARSLGWATIAAITVDHLSEHEAKAFAIADNRTAELSHWNFDELEAQIKDLKGVGDDEGLLNSLGFNSKELLSLMNETVSETVEVASHERVKSLMHKCPQCGFESEGR